MSPDTKWIDIPVPGGVERISRELWNRLEFDRETAWAKGSVYGMEHEREKIVRELLEEAARQAPHMPYDYVLRFKEAAAFVRGNKQEG